MVSLKKKSKISVGYNNKYNVDRVEPKECDFKFSRYFMSSVATLLVSFVFFLDLSFGTLHNSVVYKLSSLMCK